MKPNSTLFAWFNPKTIEACGLLLAAAGIAAFDRSRLGAAAAVCLGAYAVLRLLPAAAKTATLLRGLVLIGKWPEYAAATLAAVLVAVHGGAAAVATVAGVSLLGAGRLYTSL